MLQLIELDTEHVLSKVVASQQKWCHLSKLATAQGQLELAQEYMGHAHKIRFLLLLTTASGDVSMAKMLVETSNGAGENDVAFLSHFITGDIEKCLDTLVTTDQLPGDPFCARPSTSSEIDYDKSTMREVLSKIWKAGQSLAFKDYEVVFSSLLDTKITEQYLRAGRKRMLSAAASSQIQDLKQKVLTLLTEHRFQLMLQLGELDKANGLINVAASQQMWGQLAEMVTAEGQPDLAQECLHQSKMFEALLFLATAAGNASVAKKQVETSNEAGENYVAFVSHFVMGDIEKCLAILLTAMLRTEDASYLRTITPSDVFCIKGIMRAVLSKIWKAGQSLADPKDYENLFYSRVDTIKTEQYLRAERQRMLSATPQIPMNHHRTPIEEMKTVEAIGQFDNILSMLCDGDNDEDGDEDELKFEDSFSILNILQTLVVPPPQVMPAESSISSPTSLTQPKEEKPPVQKTISILDKSSLEDEMELDIDSLKLDEKIGTLGINLDEEYFSDA